MKHKISVNDLKGEQKELAKTIGMEAYMSLVEAYGGTSVYIAKSDKMKNLARDEEISKKFNGYNYAALAKEYGLSERTVRDIVAEHYNSLYEQITF